MRRAEAWGRLCGKRQGYFGSKDILDPPVESVRNKAVEGRRQLRVDSQGVLGEGLIDEGLLPVQCLRRTAARLAIVVQPRIQYRGI